MFNMITVLMITKSAFQKLEQSKLWYQIRKVWIRMCRSTDGRITGSSTSVRLLFSSVLNTDNKSRSGIKRNAEIIGLTVLSELVAGTSSLK